MESVSTKPTSRSPVTVSHAAKSLGYSALTIRKELEAKRIPGIRIGNDWRVSRDWLESELKKLEVSQ